MKKINLRLIRNNKEIVIDVDDYEVLEDEEFEEMTAEEDLKRLDSRIKDARKLFERRRKV